MHELAEFILHPNQNTFNNWKNDTMRKSEYKKRLHELYVEEYLEPRNKQQKAVSEYLKTNKLLRKQWSTTKSTTDLKKWLKHSAEPVLEEQSPIYTMYS
jgi:hypothetical protein